MAGTIFPNGAALLYDVNGNALAVQNGVAIPASTPALLLAGSDGTNSRYLQTRTSGALVADAAANATVSGAIAALNATVEIATDGCSAVGASITGTWVGTISAEGTIDGTNWFSISGYAVGQLGSVSSATQNGVFNAIVAGFKKIRALASAWTSGSATVTLIATIGSGITQASIAQYVQLSTTNSSTTPLGANAVFTGTAASTLGVAGIQVNVFSDQSSAARGLQVQQSTDGTNWDISDNFTIHGGRGFSTTVQATGAFCRVVYTNGSTAQGSFRLQSVLCPVVEAVPRALAETTQSLQFNRLSNSITALDNATITAAGSFVVTGFGESGANLLVNVKNAPTGTSPSIKFTITEVDPIDQTTIIGNSVTGLAITAAGTQVLQIISNKSSCLKVSWALTGTTPSFSGVNASIVEKVATTNNGDLTSFMASTNGSVSSGTANGTVQSIAYLFRSSASVKTVRLHKITISDNGGTNGDLTARGAFITAENGTPGGTSQTINGVNRANVVDPADIFRTGATGAPTRVAGDLLSFTLSLNGSQFFWEEDVEGQPIILRAGVAEGFEIRSVIINGLAKADQISVAFYWVEV